jgi:autonomous glycyl radical cofactor GrcA
VQVQSLTFFWLHNAKKKKGYCLSGKQDEAMKHLNVCALAGLENWCYYTLTLNSVLDCMVSIGLQVATNVVTCNTLINGYCKHG